MKRRDFLRRLAGCAAFVAVPTAAMHTQPAIGDFGSVCFPGLAARDAADRADFYRAQFESGVMSINDIRGAEDLPSIVGGNAKYKPRKAT
jgi:hypothetical protein